MSPSRYWQRTLRNNWWHSVPCSTFMTSSRFPKPFRLEAEFVAAKDPEDPGSLGQARLLGTGWYTYHAVSWYPLVSQLVSGRCGVVVDLEQLRSMIHQ